MKPYNTDKLYLLEMMVSRINIDYDKLGLSNDCIDSLQQIIVLCQFQNFPEMQIREEEFCKVPDKYEKLSEVVLRSGKSCLFSARGISEDLEYFTISVKVARERTEGMILLGRTCVQLDWHFVDILKENNCQNSRSIEDTYPLYSNNCCCVGSITISVRLSSLGKMILTSLQGGKENEPYVVKGEGVTTDLGGMGDHGISPQGSSGAADNFGRLLGGTEQPFQEAHPGYPPEMQGDMQYGGAQGIPYGNMQGMPYGNMYGIPHENIQGTPYGNVEGMHYGNMQAMTSGMEAKPVVGQQQSVPVQKGLKGPQGQDPYPFCGHVPIRSSSSSSDEDVPPPAQPNWPPGTFCSCDYPLPPGFENPPQPPKKKKKKKKKMENTCPLELKGDYCIKPNCPMGFPQLPGCPKQQPKSKGHCAEFPMESGSIGLGNGQMMYQLKQQQLALEQPCGPPGPATVTIEDDKNDIYILKIGAKQPNKKPKFILELKTPKLKMEEVKTQEMDSQYRTEDFTLPPPPKEPKAKGKKGGKKTEKKGKKKGKK